MGGHFAGLSQGPGECGILKGQGQAMCLILGQPHLPHGQGWGVEVSQMKCGGAGKRGQF